MFQDEIIAKLLVKNDLKTDINDEAVNDFKGTKIIFMNPRLDSEDSRTTDLLDNDSYIKDLLEELIINIVNSNTLSKEKLSYLNIL